MPAQIKLKSFDSRQIKKKKKCTWGRHASCFDTMFLWQSDAKLSEGADSISSQLCRDKECLFSGITNSGSSLDYGNAQRTQHALKVSVFRMLKLDTIQKKYYIYAYYIYIYTKAKKAVLEKQQKHCQPPPTPKKWVQQSTHLNDHGCIGITLHQGWTPGQGDN